ncbi:MAG: tetratricopeptide repeat protein [Desulfobacteraceae bacterium]|nr:tetratricopeptide repeat protein [Desulfobacteraceae bacterium]
MARYRSITIGLMLGIGLMLMLTGANPTFAEYDNTSIADKNSVTYWLDQGGLLSTYGNPKAAIRAYEKALALAPNNAETIFDMGVAYADMGDHQKALVLIDRAISLSPESGRYHYGRGWVLMLSGQNDQAYPEFQKAAELGNRDAIAYLEGSAR